jgi:hypothetical protein
MLSTLAAYGLVGCFLGMERLLRQGQEAMSLDIGPFDRGSTRLLAPLSWWRPSHRRRGLALVRPAAGGPQTRLVRTDRAPACRRTESTEEVAVGCLTSGKIRG